MKKLSVLILFVFLCISGAYSSSYASSTGISKATRMYGSSGCSCHGDIYAKIDPTVIVTISGPDTLLINQTATYTVTISGGPALKSGVNIAVSNGTLATSGSTILKLTNQELTHKAPVAYSNGQVVFQFSFKAPASEDSIVLYAAGSSSKAWNFADDKPIIVVRQMSGIEEEKYKTDFYVLQNYPNPFNPSTKIRYTIPNSAKVRLTVFNAAGQKQAVLLDAYKSAGTYELDFSGRHLASGIYYCKLEAFGENKRLITSKVQKLILMK